MKRLSPKALLLIAVLVTPALAVVPEFWEVRTYAELSAGDLDGLSITGEGELVLAPLFDELYDTGELLVLSSVVDADGTVYLGTGHNGRVFRVDGQGTGTLLADFEELDVLALAVDPDGSLIAATSPNGKVYRISADGETEAFYDPGALYIWDLAFDAEGRLLVATGEEGVIYRVTPDGSGEVFYDSDNMHILTMAVDSGGDVVAGGSPRGYVYRIADDGRAFVLYDSGMREVRSLSLSPTGAIYAAVLESAGSAQSGSSGAPNAGPSAGSPTITLSIGVQASSPPAQAASGTADEGAGSAIGSGAARGPGSGSGDSRILEILPDGAVTTIWESPSEMVFALLYDDDRLLFSTGTEGRVYALGESRRPTLLVESTEEQTTRLLLAGDRVLAGTANRGKLWELADGGRSQGRYESTIRDTGAVSTWGKLAWVGEGTRISTRSGNTASPDSTWSDWTDISPAGDIASPPARFIQWEATLEAADAERPFLASVTLPYLQQNFRPDVSSLQVLEPGLALREQQGTSNPNAVERGGVSGRVVPLLPRPPSRTVVEAGAQALRWTVTDANNDVLMYSLFYRAGNEADWKVLAAGLRDSFFTIEPNTLPDGTYQIRLVASDVGSNPPDRALSGELTTRPFAIDNTPPEVTMTAGIVEAGVVEVEAVATDTTSTLKQAEMAVDAGAWVPVFPEDGIIDTLAEDFVFSSPPLDPGEHVISFRIYDQNENVGIGKAIVVVPGEL